MDVGIPVDQPVDPHLNAGTPDQVLEAVNPVAIHVGFLNPYVHYVSYGLQFVKEFR